MVMSFDVDLREELGVRKDLRSAQSTERPIGHALALSGGTGAMWSSRGTRPQKIRKPCAPDLLAWFLRPAPVAT